MSLLPLHTLVLLLDDERLLLARKKRGFGEGYLVGIGGTVDPGESVVEGAVREVREEVGVAVDAAALVRVATLDFLFPHREGWNMRVVVFTARRWRGEPAESDEVAPAWFPRASPPLDAMWDDARLWLPEVLAGRRFRAGFTFADDVRVGRHEIVYGD